MDSQSNIQEKSRLEMARQMSGFSIATLLSRILGYFRDFMIAYTFGGGIWTDAFYAAFRIANFFRRTLGEGAMNASFVPILARQRMESREKAREFFSALWSWLLVLTAAISLLGILTARPLVLAFAYGFTSKPEILSLTVELTRILFPHLLFTAMAALCQGALNVARRFFLPAAAPLSFSISILVYLIGLQMGWISLDSSEAKVRALAYVAVFGGLLQWVVQVPALYRAGLGPRLQLPRRHPEIFQVLALMGPSLISMAADQMDTFVNILCASFLKEGSVTAIYNSSRVMQLPLALFGVAAAAVSLPQLAEKAQLRRLDEFWRILERAISLLGFLLFPAMVGLAVLDLPIVQTLFQHGRFALEHSLLTRDALFFYSFGLVAYSLSKIFVSSFYALKDAATPVKVNLLQVSLNIVLSLLLMGPLGVGGLALAASISAWIGAGSLFFLLKRRIGSHPLREAAVSLLKSLGASLGMGAFCLVIRLWGPQAPWACVLVSVAACIPLYYGFAVLLDIPERKALHLWKR